MKQLIYILLSVCLLSACTEKLAQSNFESGKYDQAIELLKKGLKPDDARQNFMLAEAYRKSNRLKEAAPYYDAARKAGSDEAGLEYYYARSLKANQRYDAAENLLREFVTSPGGEAKFKELAQIELDNLDRIGIIEAETNYFRIKELDELNTEYAEYAPVYVNGYLYFTSNRQGGKIYGTTGTPFTDLYRVRTKGANVSIRTLEALPDIINHAEVNEGTVAISSNGMSIIYAKGNTGKATGNNEVNLYFTRFRNGKWLEPRPLSINDPDAWDSTPALTPDGTTLYFSSTRAGGYGGADIYSAQLNRRGRWVDVQNLGPQINTPGDEMFPFVSDDGRMYFASDGHAGFGNLDIFVATRRRGKITVENLGQPMNSASDDFSLYQFDLTRGFFSSNRPGGKGDDDIYTFVNEDPDLKVVNYFVKGNTYTTDDAGEKIILPNTKIALVSDEGEVLDEVFSGEDGAFRFRVYAEEHYNLIGEKTDYFTTRKEFSTIGKSVAKETLTEFITNVTFETEIMMDRIVLEKPIVLNNIYYDLDKANIRPDAAVVLDSLVTIMQDNPDIFIELGSHTDARADDAYNMELSQRRAQSAVQYIIQHGIDPERIVAKGYGETQLIVPNATTEEQHQRNRRTEFKVLRYDPRETEDDLPPVDESDEYDRFFDDDELGDS
ncbi:OmpA family protein [Marinoscillum furvescens]|uniref:Tetratricopeptide repeat protein n=1 Tax=Marinoscillum furvescens DSM 4134 TaxID=1122208 RepID=A0A3D9L6J9_MARFU|nr:OmpA family protein [Marinoscillum furvescens]REE00530.1 tetratricopeptide repeat protein [Marinoscillum furvescens DSM 4134]